MREALRAHDFQCVFRLLRSVGYSQLSIGTLTGQSQPEISAIMCGQRRVLSYTIISRIADGLGVPAGYVGVAWCECHHEPTSAESLAPGAASPKRPAESDQEDVPDGC
jgi:transcriptional regulator with XRE-family HTH domain